MTLPTNPLDLAVLLHRNMQQYAINEDGYAEGVLPEGLDFQQTIRALEEQNLRGLRVDESQRWLEFSLPPNYFVSLEKLLKSAERRISPPARFYLEETDTVFPQDGDNLPDMLARYIEATDLFNALEDVADDVRQLGGEKTLVFLNQHKLELTADYAAIDLVDLDRLDYFKREFIDSDIHTQQKHTILRTELFSIFPKETRVPLSSLMGRFQDFVDHVEKSYQLYVSEFSFQKIAAEVEERKLEYTTKLNKIFSDIQNQLLVIPAALVLVGGQMKDANEWLFPNVLIWLGSLVFAVLINFLIKNQRHTLEALKDEISRQWSLMKNRHSQAANLFSSAYTQLDDRYKHQRCLLRVIDVLVAASLLGATVLLIWYSLP